MTHAVRLDVFEGPLDLLLHLVSKERVDVSEVSISTITDEYLHILEAMEEIDVEAASSFLVLAATLLEIKSLKLLPGSVEDPEVVALLEERDRLLHMLIEYSTFKGVAGIIAANLEESRDRFPRIADIPQELVGSFPDILEGVVPEDLAREAVRLLAPKSSEPVDISFIAPIRVSVRDMIELLAEQVRTRGKTSFRDLCREAAARIDVIVRFLALLELLRTGSVEVEQERPFDEIVIRWREPRLGR